MIDWGWKPERTLGIWRYGAGWMRPFVAACPYLTVLLLLLMFHMIGEKLTSAKGMLFDLPVGNMADGERTDLVAVVVPVRHETLVFFDDSRYLLGDAASRSSLAERLTERAGRSGGKTLLVLADRRVVGGELMQLAAVARRSGLDRILFAERRKEISE